MSDEMDVPIDPRGSGRLVYDKASRRIKREASLDTDIETLRARLRRAEAVAESAVVFLPTLYYDFRCRVCGATWWRDNKTPRHQPDCQVPAWLEGRDG